MERKENNFAFIDSQNLNMGVKSLGWFLDFKKFRIYLKEKYGVSVAYLFIGYIPENSNMYASLQKAGFVLKFKPVISNKDGSYKGNIDADLVLQTMIDYYENNFNKAIIVTSDGDFYSLVDYLYSNNKLEIVMSPYYKSCSILLKKKAKGKLVFLNNLRKKLEYKRKSTA
ncbi:MAG: NYN domain-containing protein [Candidatus Paceibacterota bacterium]|jgi:uncharacterized LabA/DUF88 family protein